jgi:hypothetical protein
LLAPRPTVSHQSPLLRRLCTPPALALLRYLAIHSRSSPSRAVQNVDASTTVFIRKLEKHDSIMHRIYLDTPVEVTLSDLESQYGGTPLRLYSSSLGTLDPKRTWAQNGVKRDYTVSLLKNARGGGPDGARLSRRAIGILCRFVVTASRRTRNAQCCDRGCHPVAPAAFPPDAVALCAVTTSRLVPTPF